jgi:hypothetical protein
VAHEDQLTRDHEAACSLRNKAKHATTRSRRGVVPIGLAGKIHLFNTRRRVRAMVARFPEEYGGRVAADVAQFQIPRVIVRPTS